MRKIALAVFLAISLLLAASADAKVGDGIVGLNGVLTGPLDPVLGVVFGDERVFPEESEADYVAVRLAGLVTGTITGVVRILTGSVDILTFPCTKFVDGPYSPKPRVRLLYFLGNRFEVTTRAQPPLL